MRKIITILMIIASIFVSKSQGTSNRFKINASISGFDAGKVKLNKVVDGKLKAVMSEECKQGKFTFKGTVNFPEMYYISIGDEKHIVSIFLDNSEIKVIANYDDLRNAEITGSKSHDELKHYIKAISPFIEKIEDLSKQYQKANQNRDKEAMEQIAYTYEALEKERNEFIVNYIIKNNKSTVSPLLLFQISRSMDTNKLDSILQLFDPSLNKSTYTKMLKEKLAIKLSVEIGKHAPDFTLNDPNGNPISLSSFKGKYLLIDFWASWCGPCRGENPNNVEIYKKFKDKGFEILGVSLDEKRGNWLKAIEDDGLTWPQVSDLKGWKSEAGQLYGVSSIPHTVLLDKEGVIIAKNLRGEELKEKIRSILK